MNRIRRMVGKSADNGAPNRPLQTLATALAACTLGVSAYGFASYTSPADGQGCSCKCHGKATTRRPGAAVDGYYWDTRTPAPSQGVTTEPAPEPSSGYFFLEESTKAPANVYYYDASTGEPEGSFYFDATTTTPEGDFYFDARTGDPEGNIYFEDVTEAPSGGVFTWMESNGEPSSGFFFDETEGSGDHQTDIWYVDPNSNHQAPPHPKHPEALDHPHSGGVYEWIEAEAHEHDGTSGSAPAKRNTTFRIRESHGHGGPATDPRHDNSQGSRRYGINTRDEVRGGRRSPFRQATPPEAEPHPPHAPRRIRLHTNTAAPTTPGAHSAPHAPGGFFLRSGKPATPGAPPAPAVPPSSKAHAKSWHQAYNKLNLNPRTDHPAPSGAKNSNPFFRVRTTQPHPEVHENAPPVLRYWSTNAGPGNAHGNNHQEAPAPKTAPGQWLRNRYVPLAEPHRVHQSEPHGEPHAEHRPEPLNYDARSRGRNSQPRRVRVVPGRRAAPQAIADPDLHRRGSAFDPADPKVPGRRVHEVHKAHKAHEVHEAHKAHEAHKVHEVHNAHEAHKDTQVIM